MTPPVTCLTTSSGGGRKPGRGVFVSLFTRTCSGVISPSPLSRFPFPPCPSKHITHFSPPFPSSLQRSPCLIWVALAQPLTHMALIGEKAAWRHAACASGKFYPPTQNGEPRSPATTILPPGSAMALRPRGCGTEKSCPAGAIGLGVREQDFFFLSL